MHTSYSNITSHRLDLIYRDDTLIVVNKPAGLLAVPGRGADKQDCLASRVQAEFSDALAVHRLDMATSGLMLFARGAEMQRRLSHLFREHLVAKRYVAVVSGRLEPLAGEIDLPLMRDWPNRPRQKVDFASGKPSLTRYRVLGYEATVHASIPDATTSHSTRLSKNASQVAGYQHERCHSSASFPVRPDASTNPAQGTQSVSKGERDVGITRVELEPVTGRTHQLRVHLAASGHPILGDALYGEEGRAERLLLHASALSFDHPLNAGHLDFASEPPF